MPNRTEGNQDEIDRLRDANASLQDSLNAANERYERRFAVEDFALRAGGRLSIRVLVAVFRLRALEDATKALCDAAVLFRKDGNAGELTASARDFAAALIARYFRFSVMVWLPALLTLIVAGTQAYLLYSQNALMVRQNETMQSQNALLRTQSSYTAFEQTSRFRDILTTPVRAPGQLDMSPGASAPVPLQVNRVAVAQLAELAVNDTERVIAALVPLCYDQDPVVATGAWVASQKVLMNSVKIESYSYLGLHPPKSVEVSPSEFYGLTIEDNGTQIVETEEWRVWFPVPRPLIAVKRCNHSAYIYYGDFPTAIAMAGCDLRKLFPPSHLYGIVSADFKTKGLAIVVAFDLTRADLSRVVATQIDLRGAVLIQADLSGASLGGANLRDADLTETKLKGCDLSDADLLGAFEVIEGVRAPVSRKVLEQRGAILNAGTVVNP